MHDTVPELLNCYTVELAETVRTIKKALAAQHGICLSAKDSGAALCRHLAHRIAVDMLAKTPFDIVFMDCFMPVMDGYQATAEIRKIEEGSGKRTTIVAMTANALPEDRNRCIAAGMDDYLAKLIQFKDLQQLLDKLSAKQL